MIFHLLKFCVVIRHLTWVIFCRFLVEYSILSFFLFGYCNFEAYRLQLHSSAPRDHCPRSHILIRPWYQNSLSIREEYSKRSLLCNNILKGETNDTFFENILMPCLRDCAMRFQVLNFPFKIHLCMYTFFMELELWKFVKFWRICCCYSRKDKFSFCGKVLHYHLFMFFRNKFLKDFMQYIFNIFHRVFIKRLFALLELKYLIRVLHKFKRLFTSDQMYDTVNLKIIKFL